MIISYLSIFFDVESRIEIPENVIAFNENLKRTNMLFVSLAEHDGSYTTAFKNLFDWLSRDNAKMFDNKKTVLLSISPGAKGGKKVIEATLVRFPIHGADIIGHFSFPKFQDNFNAITGISNPETQKTHNAFI